MQSTTLILLMGFLSIAAFYLGRSRSLAVVGGPGKGKGLHSLPGYHGYFVSIWCVLPPLALLSGWMLAEPGFITALVVKSLSPAIQALPAGELNLLVNNIQNLATGDVVSAAIDEDFQRAADLYNEYYATSRQLLSVIVVGLAALGGAFAWRSIHPDLRARNKVESVVRWALIWFRISGMA